MYSKHSYSKRVFQDAIWLSSSSEVRNNVIPVWPSTCLLWTSMLSAPSLWRLMYQETWKPHVENGRLLVCLVPCVTGQSRVLTETWNCEGLLMWAEMCFCLIEPIHRLELLYCYSQLFLFSLTPLHFKGKDCAQVRITYTQFLKMKISKQDKKLQHQWRLYRQVKKSGFVLKTKNQDNVQMGQSFVVR